MNEQIDYLAPKHLSEKAQRYWTAVVPRRAESVERRAMIQVALEALDRADEAAQIIAAEGMTVKTAASGAIHVNPAVRIEREARQQFHRIWTSLQLHFDEKAWHGGSLDDERDKRP